MNLEPLVQVLEGQTSNFVDAMGAAAQAYEAFYQQGGKTQRNLDNLKDAMDAVEASAGGVGAAMRAMTPATRGASDAVDMMAGKVRGATGALTEQAAAIRTLLNLSQQFQASQLQSNLSTWIGGMGTRRDPLTGRFQRVPRYNPAVGAQSAFANQAALEAYLAANAPASPAAQMIFGTAGGGIGMSVAARNRAIGFGPGNFAGARLPMPVGGVGLTTGATAAQRAMLAQALAQQGQQQPAPIGPNLPTGLLQQTFGGRFGQVGAGFAMMEGIRELIGGAKEGFIQYQSALITESQQLASAVGGAFQTAATGVVSGVEHAVTGFAEGLDESLRSLLAGEGVQGPIKGLQHSIVSVIQGIGTTFESVVSASGGLVGGAITATSGRIAAQTQAMGDTASSTIRGGGLAVATGLALSGVGIPAAVGTFVGTQLAAGVVDIFTTLSAKSTEAAGQIMGQVAGIVGGIVARIVGAVGQAATTVIGLMGSAVGNLMSLGMEVKKFETTFGVLMRDPGKGAETFQKIVELSQQSTYSWSQLSAAGQTLLSMGVGGEHLVETLTALGNVAQGDADRLRRLAFAYGEVVAEGRLTGQRIRQFATLGIGLEDFAKTMGVTGPEARRRIRGGAVGEDVVAQTINQLNAPGGRLHNLMLEQLNTAAGQWNRLEAVVTSTVGKMGSAFLESSGVLEMMKAASTWLLSVMPQLEKFASAAGEYFKAIAHEFGSLGVAFFKTIGQDFGKLDLGGPAGFAKSLASGFLDVAEAIATAAAELVAFLAILMREAPKMLFEGVKAGAEALIEVLIPTPGGDWLSGIMSDKARYGMIAGVGKIALGAMGALQGLEKNEGFNRILQGAEGAPTGVRGFFGRLRGNLANVGEWWKGGQTGGVQTPAIPINRQRAAETFMDELEQAREKHFPLEKIGAQRDLLMERYWGTGQRREAATGAVRGGAVGLGGFLQGVRLPGDWGAIAPALGGIIQAIAPKLNVGAVGPLAGVGLDKINEMRALEFLDIKKAVGGIMDKAEHLPAAQQFGSPEAMDTINKAQMQNVSVLEEVAGTLEASRQLQAQQRDYLKQVAEAMGQQVEQMGPPADI